MSVVSVKREKLNRRYAFCGSMGSGKSFTSRKLADDPSFSDNCKILSVATPIKEIAANMKQTSRAVHIMIGRTGRAIDENVWVNKLKDKLYEHSDCDIIVDDVRFINEAKMLKDEGFKLIYLKTPWHVRFKRVKLRCGDDLDDLQHFNDPSEIACESIPETMFDYVWETPSQIDDGVQTLSGSI